MLVANLRGQMLGNSILGLRFFWPVEMQYRERENLNINVEWLKFPLIREDTGCLYDEEVEHKYVLILTILAIYFSILAIN